MLFEYIRDSNIDKNIKILELGCGIGVLSISLKALGFEQIIASDLQEVVKITEKNSKFNGLDLETRVLDWTCPEYIECDLLIFADCVWVMQLVDPLVRTLKLLITEKNQCLACFKIRSNLVHEYFLKTLEENLLCLKNVYEDDQFIVSVISIIV